MRGSQALRGGEMAEKRRDAQTQGDGDMGIKRTKTKLRQRGKGETGDTRRRKTGETNQRVTDKFLATAWQWGGEGSTGRRRPGAALWLGLMEYGGPYRSRTPVPAFPGIGREVVQHEVTQSSVQVLACRATHGLKP